MIELNHYDLWTGLVGGLALFLFGMDIMTRALKTVAGDRMKNILAVLTKNRFVGAATGAGVTAIINSSSVTTVIMVGFISAGLVSMSQCVSVIMGANIGSTMTAQILAFKVTKLALPMIAVGFTGMFLAKPEKLRSYSAMLLGLGLVFYGMGVMSDAMRPLRDYEPFLDLMVSMENPFLGVLVGAAFTAVIQSSAATTGIIIVMASQGLIALPVAIAIALGANIGTCATAGLAVIGKPREAVRAAVVHVLFNVAGVLLWVAFIPEFAEFARWISPVAEGLTGVDKVAAESPRQIANAHTIFNVVNTLIFIGFTTQIARLVERLVPDRPLIEEEGVRPRYLDEELMSTPSLALDRARLEIGRVGDQVIDMFNGILPVVLSGSAADLRQISDMDAKVDTLHGHIVGYLGRISLRGLSGRSAEELMALTEAVNHLEHVGDLVETNMVTLGLRRIDEKIVVSDATRQMMENFHAQVLDALRDVVAAIRESDRELAKKVRGMKQDMAKLVQDATSHEMMRLVADEPNRLRTYTREIEIIEHMEQIFKLCRRIARAQLKVKTPSGEVIEEPDNDVHADGPDNPEPKTAPTG